MSRAMGCLVLWLMSACPCLAEMLEFKLELAQSHTRVGQPVACTMSLTNLGSEPLLVNRRLLVNWPGVFPHEVYFRITDQQGRLLPFLEMLRAGDPEPQDYILLKSGERVRRKYDLNESYPLRAGTYRVEAMYENHHQPSSLPSVWQGRLRSQPLELVVD